MSTALKSAAALSKNRVQAHLRTLATLPEPIVVPQRQPHLALLGGWSDPVENDAGDSQCHYFRITGKVEGTDLLTAESLCGAHTAEGKREELVDLDPLAIENCKTCRTILLAQRRLI